MENEADGLDKLLSAVRKTISDNKHFLDNLIDETAEEDSGNKDVEEDFEEL